MRNLKRLLAFTNSIKNFPRHITIQKTNDAMVDTVSFTSRLRKRLESAQPALTQINQYYFNGGKHFRPILLLSLSQSLHAFQDTPLEDLDPEVRVFQSQIRLAEIVELIHTASLLHDDVVDEATLRRGHPSANARFGSKSAVLSGDFMLAEASLGLAELSNLEVIRLLSTVIKDLVEGELMQMNATYQDQFQMEYYLKKSFLKTASMIAKSCQAIAILGGLPLQFQPYCYQFGKNLGLAFQLIDDKLDFTAKSSELGKPVGSDLRCGTITAPVIFASEQYPEICSIVKDNFSEKDDFERAFELVIKSDGIYRTQLLAERLIDDALKCLNFMPSNYINDRLIEIIRKASHRST